MLCLMLCLINALSDDHIKQVWYADDATACGRLMDVCRWWDRLVSIGPDFGYFPNPSKTCLIVKDCFYDSAVSIFQDSGVCVTAEGKRHLGLLWTLPPLLLPLFIREFHCGSGNSPLYRIFQLLNLMQPMLLLLVVLLAGGII